MLFVSPNRRLGIALGVAVTFAVIASMAEAEDPNPQVRPQPGLSAADVARSLGPGPLPPPRQPAGEGKRAGQEKTTAEAIDQCVQINMAQLDAPGAAVAVMLDGQMLYSRGYGLKNRLLTREVNRDTVFRIGSVTKMMTAAVVMQQVELGRVDLEAPVTDYIPEFEVGGRWPAHLITVRHALTHATGFPDTISDPFASGDDALSNWAATQQDIELHAPPGSFWNYSNPNFMLAGLVAERAAGVPYRQLYKESLWEPAGMSSTTFDPSEVVAAGNYATGHYREQSGGPEFTVGPRDNDLWAAGPAGFAFSTVGDLSRWALLLIDGGGPVLSPWSAATMQDPHQWTHYTPDRYYGYGVMVENYQGLDVRQHGGNVAGYGTYLLWVPDRRFVVALLTNVTSSLTAAAYCIVDEVLEPDPVEPEDLTTDPSTWGRYVGEYVLTETDGTSAPAQVYLDGSRLMASAEDPAQPGVFVTTELEQLYLDTFVFDSDGDGSPETDVTFCERKGAPGFNMWTRNRHAVGVRQLTPRSGRRR